MKLSIPKWKQFQHYSARRPPWIKLHRSLLENRKWHQLSPPAAKLLTECWLLASEEEAGVLTGDVVEDIAWRLHRDPGEVLTCLKELENAGFVAIKNDDSSTTLAQREHDATLEKSREEKKKSKRAPRKFSKAFEQVWSIHARGPKGKADDAYKVAVGNGVTHEVIVEKLAGYVAAELRDDFKGQHLFRWLRDERWQEEFKVKDERHRSEVIFEWFPPGIEKDQYDREGVDG